MKLPVRDGGVPHLTLAPGFLFWNHPPGTLQRRSPGESSHSVGCLGISGRCLAGSHGKCLTPVTWSVKREKKSCQRVALHIPWYKILASPELCKISVRSLKRISNYIDQNRFFSYPNIKKWSKKNEILPTAPSESKFLKLSIGSKSEGEILPR